jgi:hypothetical protein
MLVANAGTVLTCDTGLLVRKAHDISNFARQDMRISGALRGFHI